MIPSKIKPLFNHILVTADKYEADVETDSGLVLSKQTRGSLKPIQRVVAIGNTVSSMKVGDYVQINPTRYMRDSNSLKDVGKSKEELHFEFPVVTIKGKDYLFLFDSDIDYIIEEFDADPDTKLYKPGDSKLITP